MVEALGRFGGDYKYLLVGPRESVKRGLLEAGVDEGDSRIEFVDAPDVIGMDEHPVRAIREKPRSSIVVSMDLVKSGHAEGVFSAGNTGAAVGAAFLKWRMLEGVTRPGIATVLPGEDSPWVLMDSGATVDCTPTVLMQFAIMGNLYAREVLGVKSPRVGLLSNGTEEGKGNRQVQEAYELIKGVGGINFIGNVEGHDLFRGVVDVVVCDGFVGNIVLKTSEQLARSLTRIIKASVMKKVVWKLGGLMCKGAFSDVKRATDPGEVGARRFWESRATASSATATSGPTRLRTESTPWAPSFADRSTTASSRASTNMPLRASRRGHVLLPLLSWVEEILFGR